MVTGPAAVIRDADPSSLQVTRGLRLVRKVQLCVGPQPTSDGQASPAPWCRSWQRSQPGWTFRWMHRQLRGRDAVLAASGPSPGRTPRSAVVTRTPLAESCHLPVRPLSRPRLAGGGLGAASQAGSWSLLLPQHRGVSGVENLLSPAQTPGLPGGRRASGVCPSCGECKISALPFLPAAGRP